jgi:hypothetical protein
LLYVIWYQQELWLLELAQALIEGIEMNQTHSVPEIYNPDVPYEVKCEIVTQLCRILAYHKNMTPDDLRKYLLEKTHVDFENLNDNPVGMLLLYEYLYSQRPQACDGVKENLH